MHGPKADARISSSLEQWRRSSYSTVKRTADTPKHSTTGQLATTGSENEVEEAK